MSDPSDSLPPPANHGRRYPAPFSGCHRADGSPEVRHRHIGKVLITLARRRRVSYLPTLTVSLLTIAVGTALSITVNLASDVIKLPSWLSAVQRHPVVASGVLTVVMFALWAAGYFLGEAQSQPATSDELTEATEGLHDQLDRIEVSQLEADDRVLSRLPPLARQVLDGDVDHQDTWQVVVGFTRDATEPFTMAREWAVAPPAAAAALSADGQVCVAEIMLAFGQPKAALRYMRAALDLGVSPRAFWLFRATQMATVSFPS